MRPGHCRILLVEDDELQQVNVRRAFARAGITEELVIASDGVEALELLRAPSGYSHLVLLDVHMPRMDGLAFLREVRADPVLKSLVVVILSTSDEEHDKAEAQSLNVAGYLLKSMSFPGLVAQLKSFHDYWAMMEVP